MDTGGFIDRDPDAPVRTRRALDKLSLVVNSLIRDGTLVLTAPGVYGVNPSAFGVQPNLPPAFTQDEPEQPGFAFTPPNVGPGVGAAYSVLGVAGGSRATRADIVDTSTPAEDAITIFGKTGAGGLSFSQIGETPDGFSYVPTWNGPGGQWASFTTEESSQYGSLLYMVGGANLTSTQFSMYEGDGLDTILAQDAFGFRAIKANSSNGVLTGSGAVWGLKNQVTLESPNGTAQRYALIVGTEELTSVGLRDSDWIEWWAQGKSVIDVYLHRWRQFVDITAVDATTFTFQSMYDAGWETRLTITDTGALWVLDPGTTRTNLGLAIGVNVQAFDLDLSALAGLTTTGVVVRTGAGTATTVPLNSLITPPVIYRDEPEDPAFYPVPGPRGATGATGAAGAGGSGSIPSLIPEEPDATFAVPATRSDVRQLESPLGQIIAATSVATQESTTSTTAVDLTTVQSVTFDLAVACDVIIYGFASCINTTAASRLQVIYADIDGTDNIISQIGNFSTSLASAAAGALRVSLSAGSHTVKMQFASALGGSAFFSERALIVVRAS